MRNWFEVAQQLRSYAYVVRCGGTKEQMERVSNGMQEVASILENSISIKVTELLEVPTAHLDQTAPVPASLPDSPKSE
jgi:hypothetical protein